MSSGTGFSPFHHENRNGQASSLCPDDDPPPPEGRLLVAPRNGGAMPFRGGAHGGAEPAGGAAVYKVRATAADAQFAELLAVLGSTGDAGVSWGSPIWLLCSG